jgi:hypothetical protein
VVAVVEAAEYRLSHECVRPVEKWRLWAECRRPAVPVRRVLAAA